MAEGGT